MKRVMSIKEAAEYLNVSPSTIRRFCKDGTLVPEEYGAGKKKIIRIRTSDLIALTERNHASVPSKNKPLVLKEAS